MHVCVRVCMCVYACVFLYLYVNTCLDVCVCVQPRWSAKYFANLIAEPGNSEKLAKVTRRAFCTRKMPCNCFE